MVANKRSTCSHKIWFSSPTSQFVKQPIYIYIYIIFFVDKSSTNPLTHLHYLFFRGLVSACEVSFLTQETQVIFVIFLGSYDFDATESSCVCQRAEEFPTFSRVSYGVIIHSDKESNFFLVKCTVWIIISEEYPSYGHLRWPTISNDTAISQLKL